MSDTRNTLDQARRLAPEMPADIHGLYRRRDAKARRTRVTTIVVASAIGLGSLSFGLGVVRHTGGVVPASGDQLGPATTNLRLGEGDYYYQRFDAGYGVCESWWALDDSGRLATTVSGPTEAGSCWGSKGGVYGPGEFYSDSGPVAQLSTDPVELEQQIRERMQPDGASPEPFQDWDGSGGTIEAGLIRSIGELLEAPDVSPQQKAALMLVAANLDGVQVDVQAHDPEGRSAILLTTDTEHQTQRWWFDAESHQPLALSGTFSETVLASGIVGTTDSSDLDRSFFRQLQS